MPKPPGDRPAQVPGRAALHEAALRHLSRYAATEAGLLRVLERRILRWQRMTSAPAEAAALAREAARDVVRALVLSGAIDDRSFAEARARRLVRAGRSRHAVSVHLAAKGVDPSAAGAALPDGEVEFMAAVAFARRRRIGPFGAEEDGGERALAAFARAGFPRATAERALRLPPDEAAALLERLRRL